MENETGKISKFLNMLNKSLKQTKDISKMLSYLSEKWCNTLNAIKKLKDGATVIYITASVFQPLKSLIFLFCYIIQG